MSPKIDFLKECLSEVSSKIGKVVPIDDMTKAFCVVCGNRECARSIANNSKFDRRVSNWQSALFINAPRAAENDPAFAGIRAKQFLPIMRDTTVHEIQPTTRDQSSLKIDIVESTSENPSSEQVSSENNRMHEPPARQPVISTPANPVSIPIPNTPTQEVTNTPFMQAVTLPQPKQEITIEPGQTFVFEDLDEE